MQKCPVQSLSNKVLQWALLWYKIWDWFQLVWAIACEIIQISAGDHVHSLTSRLLYIFYFLFSHLVVDLKVWDWSCEQNDKSFHQITWYIEFWAFNSKRMPLHKEPIFETLAEGSKLNVPLNLLKWLIILIHWPISNHLDCHLPVTKIKHEGFFSEKKLSVFWAMIQKGFSKS